MASAYLKWKYRDVKRNEPVEYTKAQRRANWWRYHKCHVCVGLLLLLAACSFAWGKVQAWRDQPDYQIAYVGTAYLPEETEQQIKESFVALGEDANGNGKITVQLNQYVFPSADPEMAASASVLLTSDIVDCESFFFLLEDPEWFQASYHTLCRLDSSLPADWDDSIENSCLTWQDTELYLARRGFWNEKTVANPDACGTLWNKIVEEAVK